MQTASYVVQLVSCDDVPPFKHFKARADAVEYGRTRVQSGAAERANIYEVAGADDAATAIALWHAGNAAHIQTCSMQASDSEIAAANRRAVDTARKAGPFALLKYLGVFPRDAPDPSKIKRGRKDL
jgi:hypothetical protein